MKHSLSHGRAFCRRITAVYNFDISKDIPVIKFAGELKKPPTLIEIADDGGYFPSNTRQFDFHVQV